MKCLGDQIKKNEMGRACGMYWGEEMCIQDFGGKPEEKGQLGRPKHRWEDNIKMYLQEVGWGAWSGFIWVGIGTGG
jgi:hypothetical protein